MINPLIIGIGIIAILGISLLMMRLKRHHRIQRPTLYMDALNAMLEGKYEEALEKLKSTVKTDTNNMMAYIYLGDVFRKLNFPVRASKVHRNLLVRNDIHPRLINLILHRLILDYQEAGMPDKAAEVAERLILTSKHDLDAKRLLLSIYEEKEDWDKAFFHRQSLNRWVKKKDQDVLALYKVQSGLVQISEGKEREGRIRFREAIKLDKKCPPAYLNWCDSYRREGRNEDAFRVLKDFIHQNPQWAHLTFDRLKMILFDLGRYGDIEHLYTQILRKKPEKPDVYLAMTELYIKEGRPEEALNLAHKAIELYPEYDSSRLSLIHVYQHQNKKEDALREALKLLSQKFRKDAMLVCSHCGYETSDPLWRCPKCHQWKTFLGEK